MLTSLTRLRIDRWRNLTRFLKLSNGSIVQAIQDKNCLGGATYLGPGLTFWTATLWTDEAAMIHFIRTGAHKEALPWLSKWCSEAATTHF